MLVNKYLSSYPGSTCLHLDVILTSTFRLIPKKEHRFSIPDLPHVDDVISYVLQVDRVNNMKLVNLCLIDCKNTWTEKWNICISYFKMLPYALHIHISLPISHKDDRKINIPRYIILFAIQLEMPHDIRNQSTDRAGSTRYWHVTSAWRVNTKDLSLSLAEFTSSRQICCQFMVLNLSNPVDVTIIYTTEQHMASIVIAVFTTFLWTRQTWLKQLYALWWFYIGNLVYKSR